MYVGKYMIGMVKANIKVFCKDTIENITNNCLGVSYLMLRSKPIVPRGMLMIDIGYKYNYHKVIYYIVTEDTGRKNSVIPYLYN